MFQPNDPQAEVWQLSSGPTNRSAAVYCAQDKGVTRVCKGNIENQASDPKSLKQLKK